MQWKVSQALARNFCSHGHPLHWPHGIINCPVHSQRSWTRVMATCQVSAFYRISAKHLPTAFCLIRCCPLLSSKYLFFIVFLHCLFLHRSITNSLPNVALPKVPSLPLNLPQMPSFTTPTWMTSMYESTCVFFNNLLTVCQLCMALLMFCAAVFGLHGVYNLLVGNYCFLGVSQAWTVSKLCFLVPLNELVLNSVT